MLKLEGALTKISKAKQLILYRKMAVFDYTQFSC